MNTKGCWAEGLPRCPLHLQPALELGSNLISSKALPIPASGIYPSRHWVPTAVGLRQIKVCVWEGCLCLRNTDPQATLQSPRLGQEGASLTGWERGVPSPGGGWSPTLPSPTRQAGGQRDSM